MSTFIFDLLGIESKQLIIRTSSLVEFIFYTLILTLPFQKTKNFGLKLCIILPFTLPLILLVASINSLHPYLLTGIVNIFMYLFVLAALCILFKEALSELLLCLVGGIAIQMIVGRLYELLILMVKNNPYETHSFFRDTVPLRDWTIYFLVHFSLSLILALIFRRKEVHEHDRANQKLILFFSLSFILMTVLLNSFSRSFEGNNDTLVFIIRAFSILYGLLTLLLRTRILEASKLKRELLIMDELIYSEKKQFDNMKSEIEIINMKCHDLRQQLSNISYKLTIQEIEALNAAIEVYDTNIKTGSDILDVILYKKKLFCEKNQIDMTCMADGQCLSFISPSHLYSLLSNAIENALEAVQSVTDEKKRTISIWIGKENGITAIHVTNYFNAELVIIDNLPQTSKKDKNHHGYGMKSMRHIAQQYNGTLSFHTEDDIFFLHIYFPNTKL